jgi:hypothetical protein
MTPQEREDLRSFAHDAIQDMLSYNVEKYEAFLYITNEIDLCDATYELQCCIFDNDPVGYLKHREFHNKLMEARSARK